MTPYPNYPNFEKFDLNRPTPQYDAGYSDGYKDGRERHKKESMERELYEGLARIWFAAWALVNCDEDLPKRFPKTFEFYKEEYDNAEQLIKKYKDSLK